MNYGGGMSSDEYFTSTLTNNGDDTSTLAGECSTTSTFTVNNGDTETAVLDDTTSDECTSTPLKN